MECKIKTHWILSERPTSMMNTVQLITGQIQKKIDEIELGATEIISVSHSIFPANSITAETFCSSAIIVYKEYM